MSFAPLSDFLCKREFLDVSAGHLGLYHGDTETSHPYVSGTLEADQIMVAHAPTAKQAPIAPRYVARHVPVSPSTGALITMMFQARREASILAARNAKPNAP